MSDAEKARLVILREELEKAEARLFDGRTRLALFHVQVALVHLMEFEKLMGEPDGKGQVVRGP